MSTKQFDMKPMSIARIIDRALRLAPSAFSKMIVPFAVMSVLSGFINIGRLMEKHPLVFFAIWLIFLALSFFIGIACMIIAKDVWFRNHDTSLKLVMKKISGKFLWKYFELSVVMGVNTVLLSLLFIIPGIIYSVNRIFSYYILVTEDTTIKEALSRSKELMSQQSWWALRGPLTRLTAIGIVVGVIQMALMSIGGALGAAQGTSAISIPVFIGLYFIYMLGTYFVLCLQILCYAGLYNDLCIRYHGADIMQDLDSLMQSNDTRTIKTW